MVATRQSAPVIKMSGQNHSATFKSGLTFSFTVIIFALNNFPLLLKSFITKELEYKAILKFKNNLYALLYIS